MTLSQHQNQERLTWLHLRQSLSWDPVSFGMLAEGPKKKKSVLGSAK